MIIIVHHLDGANQLDTIECQPRHYNRRKGGSLRKYHLILFCFVLF